jgi:hypothetical protein
MAEEGKVGKACGVDRESMTAIALTHAAVIDAFVESLAFIFDLLTYARRDLGFSGTLPDEFGRYRNIAERMTRVLALPGVEELVTDEEIDRLIASLDEWEAGSAESAKGILNGVKKLCQHKG